MNPNLCRVVLRPRGPLEVFDLCWRLLRESWAAQAKMLGLVWLPPALLGALLAWASGGSPWLLLYPLLLGPVLQAPFTLLTGRLLFDPDVSVSAVLGQTGKRLPALVGAWASGWVGWLIGVATCLYGLLPMQAALLYLPEAVLLERVGVGRAARRTLRLASAHVGIALLGAVARWVLAVWAGIVGEGLGHFIFTYVLQLGSPFGSLQSGQITPFLIAGVLLSNPLFAVYRLLLYVDVRTRTEGWDLQVGLRAAGLAR